MAGKPEPPAGKHFCEETNSATHPLPPPLPNISLLCKAAHTFKFSADPSPDLHSSILDTRRRYIPRSNPQPDHRNKSSAALLSIPQLRLQRRPEQGGREWHIPTRRTVS
ncbi:hypothetical protein VTL71DRAFT_11747 [Oculimacula yallundae]|uniref:Uncharacterized protein n=1 Tax=Oculimacula yallundae TaxID=86028 RepID=A0ABR4CRB6_9HELO